jgi:hypothetical protein
VPFCPSCWCEPLGVEESIVTKKDHGHVDIGHVISKRPMQLSENS